MTSKLGTKQMLRYTCIGEGCDVKLSRPNSRCKACAKLVKPAKDAAYQREHREELAVKDAAKYQAHKEEVKERTHQWKLDNPDRKRENNRKYKRVHPEASRASCSRRRTRAKVKMTLEDMELSRCYRLAIVNDPCFYCGGPGEEDDHYVSIANGGTDHWWNLVRACSRCNRQKSAMNGDDFIPRKVFPHLYT